MSDNFWALVIAVINIGLWSILYVYIYYNLLLIWLEWHTRNKTTPPPPAPEEWPGVTVQLPMYNEAEVCEALLAAVVALDYPRDKLHIQVLDDSTDRTSALVAARVAEYQRQGVSVSHLQRVDRVGYKAGALAEGLLETDDPFLLLLDADFLPNPTLLREVLPHFADPKVGMVQARWGHIRPPATSLERSAAFWIDRHFAIEQVARSRSGHFFHFNGTGGVWRRSAIDDAGGWAADTLAEDLDLSLRAWQKGWRFVYAHDTIVPALLPPDVRALKIQQGRWSTGAFQVARKHLPALWRSSQRKRDVAFITLQVTGYSFPTLLLALALFAAPAAWARPHLGSFWRFTMIDLPATSFVVGLIVQAVISGARRGRQAGWLEFEASSLGLGLAPLVFSAGLQGLRSLGGAFQRTPKRTGGAEWLWSSGAAIEVGLAIWCAAGAVGAGLLGGWSCVPIPLVASVGLAVFGVGSMRGSAARTP